MVKTIGYTPSPVFMAGRNHPNMDGLLLILLIQLPTLPQDARFDSEGDERIDISTVVPFPMTRRKKRHHGEDGTSKRQTV